MGLTPGVAAVHATSKIPAQMFRLHVPPQLLGPRVPFNPSLAVHRDRLRVIVRLARLGGYDTINCLGWIGQQWDLCNPRIVHRYIEDCRLFVWRDQLHATGTAVIGAIGAGRAQMAMVTFDDADAIVRSEMLPAGGPCEKNWMPVVRGEALAWVYSTRPLIVLPYEACHPHREGVSFDLRGGSQLVPYKDGFLAVVHEQHRAAGIGYIHRLVWFSADLKTVKVGRRFVLRAYGIEFVAGLARWRDHWVMSFGAGDSDAWLAVVNDATVAQYLEEV